MTRARERLFVTHTQSRFLYGNRQYMMPSRFFTDVVGEPQRVQRYDEDGVPLFEIKPKSPVPVGGSDTKTTVSLRPKINIDKTVSNFKVGQKVCHQMYGEGMILNISNGHADVVFQSVGKKVLNLKYAPLNPID